MTAASPHAVPFHELTQVEFVEAQPGRACVRAPDVPRLKNHLGTLHGGMTYALGEIAAAVAILGLLGETVLQVRAITRRGAIEYLKPARGAITATGQVTMTRDAIEDTLTRQPSLSVPIDVTLADAGGVTVATMKLEWFVGQLSAAR